MLQNLNIAYQNILLALCKKSASLKSRTTYIRTSSTFCNFELEDGNVVINNDWFAVLKSRNNKLFGVHVDVCSVGANGEHKVLIPSAL